MPRSFDVLSSTYATDLPAPGPRFTIEIKLHHSSSHPMSGKMLGYIWAFEYKPGNASRSARDPSNLFIVMQTWNGSKLIEHKLPSTLFPTPSSALYVGNMGFAFKIKGESEDALMESTIRFCSAPAPGAIPPPTRVLYYGARHMVSDIPANKMLEALEDVDKHLVSMGKRRNHTRMQGYASRTSGNVLLRAKELLSAGESFKVYGVITYDEKLKSKRERYRIYSLNAWCGRKDRQDQRLGILSDSDSDDFDETLMADYDSSDSFDSEESQMTVKSDGPRIPEPSDSESDSESEYDRSTETEEHKKYKQSDRRSSHSHSRRSRHSRAHRSSRHDKRDQKSQERSGKHSRNQRKHEKEKHRRSRSSSESEDSEKDYDDGASALAHSFTDLDEYSDPEEEHDDSSERTKSRDKKRSAGKIRIENKLSGKRSSKGKDKDKSKTKSKSVTSRLSSIIANYGGGKNSSNRGSSRDKRTSSRSSRRR